MGGTVRRSSGIALTVAVLQTRQLNLKFKKF